MSDKRSIKDFAVSIQADHEQYWPGHDISFTEFTDCATGASYTPKEALDDAIESLIQQGFEITEAQEKEMEKALQEQITKPYDLNTHISIKCEHEPLSDYCKECEGSGEVNGEICTECDGTGEPNEPPDCSVCAGDWYFYVSIDVK